MARFELVSEFFHAVLDVFRADWEGHTPKTSRLLHGAGLVAMGYIMDELYAGGARRRRQFAHGLQLWSVDPLDFRRMAYWRRAPTLELNPEHRCGLSANLAPLSSYTSSGRCSLAVEWKG